MNCTQPEAEQYRLRWQCRRGMLELDLLLHTFLDNGFAKLNNAERDAFVELLNTQDQELLELLMGRNTHKDVSINEIVKKIRQQHND
jgi:antitoxin CptB